jgi:c-di-GMP-binding flagellar brake protein YcgR
MMPAGRQSDFRNSVRFPLQLQVTLKTPGGELHAKTTDISAGGVLLHLDSAIEVGAPVQFAIEMPAELLGTQDPVEVMCAGRVVRCLRDASGQSVAVVIDEYHFQRLQRSEGE